MFNNKIVLITGATSGIGKACAFKFAEAGDDLILTGRREERLIEIKTKLEKKFKINVNILCFDIRDKEQTFNAIDSINEDITHIDLLVNNAGLAAGKEPFDEADIDDWDNMLQTNVNGLLYVSKAVLPLLKNSKQPHIINIGSTAGREVYENGNVYCASKFAVDAITKSMRIDLLKFGIKVTAINPGAAETEFSLVRFKGDEHKAASAYENYEPLTPENIADVLYYTTCLPANVCINDLTITCLAQANNYYTYKK